MPYPYQFGKHNKKIKWLIGIYQPHGVMGLWDKFLNSESEFAKKTGYSIECFITMLPSLADTDWKKASQKYEGMFYDVTFCEEKII